MLVVFRNFFAYGLKAVTKIAGTVMWYLVTRQSMNIRMYFKRRIIFD